MHKENTIHVYPTQWNKKEGQRVGNQRGQFIVNCSCSHWEFLTSFLPGTVNHTNHIREVMVFFGNYFWNREMKRKLHTRVQIFRLSLAISLTFSHLYPVAAVRMSVRQQRQSGGSWKKPRCDAFFFPMVCLFNIKKFCDAYLYGKAAGLHEMLERRNAGFSWQ